MASGMELMFKSMGIDIDAIKAMINPQTVKKTLTDMQNAQAKLEAIEAALLRIEMKLQTLPSDYATKLLLDNQEHAMELLTKHESQVYQEMNTR
jgi:hypothetical protein